MKKEEKLLARKLRSEGLSMRDIQKRLGVSRASVSFWTRDIVLSPEQRNKLEGNPFNVEAVEKRRLKRLANSAQARAAIRESAARQIRKISDNDLLLIGAALYWGEGGKSTSRNVASVTNADPFVIRVMMRFFKKICLVPEEKFKGHIHIHSHLNVETAEKYWSGVSGIPRSQFYKTYTKPSIASKGKRDTLPYGTFDVYVCDVKLFHRIMGWIEGLKSGVLLD